MLYLNTYMLLCMWMWVHVYMHVCVWVVYAVNACSYVTFFKSKPQKYKVVEKHAQITHKQGYLKGILTSFLFIFFFIKVKIGSFSSCVIGYMKFTKNVPLQVIFRLQIYYVLFNDVYFIVTFSPVCFAYFWLYLSSLLSLA